MIFRFCILLVLLLAFNTPALSQENPVWDDTRSKTWPAEAQQVNIVSSADGKSQSAYFYKAPGNTPRPLIVSLHTWSGDFRQKDTLIHFCIKRGYHYIHPDFRGPNRSQDAMGSDLVISDIDDAISYCLENAMVDSDNIHVNGVSGGGHATVLAYMKSKHNIRSFSAYVGIYNLVDWYYESLGRGQRYAGDIAASTSGNRQQLDVEQAKARSPFFMTTPAARRNSKLNLYCGIHDGYTGSVPIRHSLTMYNKVVKDFQPRAVGALVPEELIETMVRERSLPGLPEQGKFLDRKIIYQNHFKDLVSLIVFEGGHEMPAGDVLAHVPARRILAIGDSNGAMEGGWVDQLKKMRPADKIVNTCISGNTIGFDNLEQSRLNTLKNIDRYVDQADGRLDAIVVMLGTNDCKMVFDTRLNEVPGHLNDLISKIKELVSKKSDFGNPLIYIVSPPPYGTDEKLAAKYQGASRRVKILNDRFAEVANKNNVRYIETQKVLEPVFPYVSPDGVHLSQEGQIILASILNEALEKEL